MRAIVTVALVVLAYHYSLVSLGRGLTAQTPLAYLALVPAMALGLAWVTWSTQPARRTIHDRQVDLIIGAGLLGIAVTLLALLPETLDARFWLYRVDLLTMPLFVGGLVALLYGVPQLWAMRLPILFLFMAWPALYLPVIGEGMRASVDLSIGALVLASQGLPFARPMSGGAEGLFMIEHGGESFVLGVASACSGVNSLVGFALIGTALMTIVRGPLLRRLAWLVTGMMATWLLNLVRMQLIFVVGHLFGRDAAMEILHPVAGLILFNIGIVAMLLLVKGFGLRLVRRLPSDDARSSVSRPSRLGTGMLAVAVAASALFGFVNATYARYEPLADGAGHARLERFPIDESLLAGWEILPVAAYEHGAAFFGEDSTWNRLRYTSTSEAGLRSNEPIFVDVVETKDANALIAYGLEECYTFHNYTIESRGAAELAPGVQAELLSYVNPRYRNLWTILKWELPFQGDDGETWYQRVVVMVPNGTHADLAGPIPTNLTTSGRSMDRTEAFLVALARGLVQRQIALSTAA